MNLVTLQVGAKHELSFNKLASEPYINYPPQTKAALATHPLSK